MRIRLDEAAALAAVIKRDLEAITSIETHANRIPLVNPTREQVDSLGFALHNVYNALENSFSQISLTFENHIKDRTKWHRELLEKMFLDVPPLRPAVLRAANRPLLADMLGFRHLFRHAYDFSLDEHKTCTLWSHWKKDGPQVKADLEDFTAELQKHIDSGSRREDPSG